MFDCRLLSMKKFESEQNFCNGTCRTAARSQKYFASHGQFGTRTANDWMSLCRT